MRRSTTSSRSTPTRVCAPLHQPGPRRRAHRLVRRRRRRHVGARPAARRGLRRRRRDRPRPVLRLHPGAPDGRARRRRDPPGHVADERLPRRPHRRRPTTSSCSTASSRTWRWPLYVACATRVVDELGCVAVVTVGATADAIPHTRMPPVVGSTADVELARRLALSAPSYQGVTGLIGVLHVEMERAGVPTISLRVGVPHYLGHMEHPLAVAALVRHLAHVLGLPIAVDLGDVADRWSAPARRGGRRRRAAAVVRAHAGDRVRPPCRGDPRRRRRHRQPLRGVPARPARRRLTEGDDGGPRRPGGLRARRRSPTTARSGRCSARAPGRR